MIIFIVWRIDDRMKIISDSMHMTIYCSECGAEIEGVAVKEKEHLYSYKCYTKDVKNL